jgi:hypothetical protein
MPGVIVADELFRRKRKSKEWMFWKRLMLKGMERWMWNDGRHSVCMIVAGLSVVLQFKKTCWVLRTLIYVEIFFLRFQQDASISYYHAWSLSLCCDFLNNFFYSFVLAFMLCLDCLNCCSCFSLNWADSSTIIPDIYTRSLVYLNFFLIFFYNDPTTPSSSRAAPSLDPTSSVNITPPHVDTAASL